MKIGYFATNFPYKDRIINSNYNKRYPHGGTEAAAYNLAVCMGQKNHEVNVFTSSIDSKDSIERHKNIIIHRYGTNFKIESANVSYNLFRKPVIHQVDIIHTHFSTPPSELAALRYAKKKKIPFVLTYHGDAQNDFGNFLRRISVSLYNKHFLDKVLSHADVIISPSEYYIDESRFLGRYRDKIVVIPNGINLSDFDIPYSKDECREKLGLPLQNKIILSLGGLAPYKGPHVLIKAMREVIKKVPDARLILVGGSKMKGELEELARKLGVKNYVKFAGFVTEDVKPLYYRAADVFVLPSIMRKEVFPIVLLESSASGLPMVVSDLDTFKCIIERGYNGLFTKKGDEKNLADAIIYLLGNEEVREKMGKNARDKVEDYSWEKIAGKTERLYELVLSGERIQDYTESFRISNPELKQNLES